MIRALPTVMRREVGDERPDDWKSRGNDRVVELGTCPDNELGFEKGRVCPLTTHVEAVEPKAYNDNHTRIHVSVAPVRSKSSHYHAYSSRQPKVMMTVILLLKVVFNDQTSHNDMATIETSYTHPMHSSIAHRKNCTHPLAGETRGDPRLGAYVVIAMLIE